MSCILATQVVEVSHPELAWVEVMMGRAEFSRKLNVWDGSLLKGAAKVKGWGIWHCLQSLGR